MATENDLLTFDGSPEAVRRYRQGCVRLVLNAEQDSAGPSIST